MPGSRSPTTRQVFAPGNGFSSRNGLARMFHSPNRCCDRPRTIDRRVGSRLPDMRAKSQTALSEWAGEKRPRGKSGFALGFLVSRNRSIIHIVGGLAPLARMSCTPGRQMIAWNRLWFCGGVRCETSGLGLMPGDKTSRTLSVTSKIPVAWQPGGRSPTGCYFCRNFSSRRTSTPASSTMPMPCVSFRFQRSSCL